MNLRGWRKQREEGENEWKWHSAEPNLIRLLALDWAFPSLSLEASTSRGPDVALPVYVSVIGTL